MREPRPLKLPRMLNSRKFGTMMATISARTIGRSLLAVVGALVLLLQLLVSASATSNDLAIKFVQRGIPLAGICGATPVTKGDRAAHIEGLNSCCFWAKPIALASLVPPTGAVLVSDRPGPAKVVFALPFAPFVLPPSTAPPRATGPPSQG